MQILMLAVFHTRSHLPRGGLIAFALIGHHHSRDVFPAVEELAEACLGRNLVTTALHPDGETMAILSHGPPEIMLLPMKREKHCIQAPLIPTG